MEGGVPPHTRTPPTSSVCREFLTLEKIAEARTVDPLTSAGQNLNALFRNKKGKTVLDAQWVRKCVDAGKILAYKSDWAGCRVTGKERSVSDILAAIAALVT